VCQGIKGVGEIGLVRVQKEGTPKGGNSYPKNKKKRGIYTNTTEGGKREKGDILSRAVGTFAGLRKEEKEENRKKTFDYDEFEKSGD